MVMEFEDSEVVTRFTTSLEIKIPRYHTIGNEGRVVVRKSEAIQDEKCLIDSIKVIFTACVYPYINRYDDNRNGSKSESWLEFQPSVTFNDDRLQPPDHGNLSCEVRIVDVNKEFRSPKLFVRNLSEFYIRDSKYRRRSYIIDNADEFLPDGVLTLRCDFSFEFSPRYRKETKDFSIRDSIPSSNAFNALTEIKHSQDSFVVYDYTGRILTLPQLHESRRRFGVYGIPPVPSFCTLESDEDILESVWMFDTRNGRFLLPLDERQDTVGVRLLNASPVIRGMVNTPMKEQHKKHVEFPDTENGTFVLVLYFLEHEAFPPSVTRDFILMNSVYRFSHLYLMEEMKRKCAEGLINSSNDFKMQEEFVNLFSDDEYLSSLLESFRQGYELPRFRKDDTSNPDCYT